MEKNMEKKYLKNFCTLYNRRFENKKHKFSITLVGAQVGIVDGT
jgi:hypothetical protein